MKFNKKYPPILTAFSFLFILSMSKPVNALSAELFSATLVEYKGQVSLQKQGEDVWLSVDEGMPLEEGDRLLTGIESYAEILIDDGSLLKLDASADITLTELSVRPEEKTILTSIFLRVGRLLSNIARFKNRRSRFQVYTPTAVVGIRGTEFVIETKELNQTDVGVFGGEVYVGGLDQYGELIKGSEVIIPKDRQTLILKNKRPQKPFFLKKEMQAHRKKLKILKEKAIERRKNLKKIIETRKKVNDKIKQKRKDIKQKRSKKQETPVLKEKNQKVKKQKKRKKKKRGKR